MGGGSKFGLALEYEHQMQVEKMHKAWNGFVKNRPLETGRPAMYLLSHETTHSR